ncbi:hypothetical protein SLS64_009595 [Diaporthe eres]
MSGHVGSQGTTAAGEPGTKPLQELVPALVGAEGVVPADKHQHPKVQRHLPSLLVGPGDQTEVGHLTNGVQANSDQTEVGHLTNRVIAFGVTYDADESGRGQHFDDEVARTHAARVAEIEAALNSQNAHLEEVLNARHAGRLSRAAPAAISALGQ